MSDKPQCFDCMYCDHNTYKTEPGIFSEKIYYLCTKFKVWRHENANACDAFVGDHNCFLTTACVRYKGLPDDCRELRELRRFRDEVLTEMSGGRELIDEYYRIAPPILARIDGSDKREAFYEYIYSQISDCLAKLENKDYEATKNIYTAMVERLKAECAI